MSTYNWKLISSEIQHRNPHFDVVKDRVFLPNKEIIDYYFIDEPNSVMIIPVISSTEIVLLRQYKYLTKSLSWELPCGSIKKGEAPKTAALRELEEEAGYRAMKLENIHTVNISTGTSVEKMHLFIAKDLIKTQQNLEITEKKTEVEIVNIEKAVELVRENEILCCQTLLCLMYWIYKLYPSNTCFLGD